MKIELKIELDTEKEKDEDLLAKLVGLLEDRDIDNFEDNEVDKT